MTSPAWPDVQAWLRDAKNTVEILPPDEARRDELRARAGVSLESALGPDQGFHIHPPPWSKGPTFYERSWKPVPMAELYHVAFDVRDQLRGQG